MTTTKTTYEMLLGFNIVAQNYLRKNKENADTKLGYAISKMAKKVQKAIKPIQELEQSRNEKIEETNIDFASVDPTSKVIVFDITKDDRGQDVRNYRYTKEDLKKRNIEIKKVAKEHEDKFNEMLEKEVELESPYYSTEMPADLTSEEIKYFTGIVLNPIAIKVTNGELQKQD